MSSLRTRRAFLRELAWAGAGCWAAGRGWADVAASPREAMFYDSLPRELVQCRLCPWQCRVPPGKRGRCGVRENRGGKYYSLVYGLPVAVHNDPIEKKPFAHVYPGSTTYSLATVGCNFRCKFCQNWEISQAAPEQFAPRFVPPEEIARRAVAAGLRTVAYTYSEPTIFYEYMRDCAAAARDKGLGNLMIGNGFISREPLEQLLPLMTAVKIDLKSMDADFYERICEGRLEPVQQTLKTIRSAGVWLEIVVLLIPTLNDQEEQLRRMSAWILETLGPGVPVHFIRFHPQYQMRNLPPTPPRSLERAYEIAAAAGLSFVYATGVAGATFCPQCKAKLIDRFRDVLLWDHMDGPRCPACGATIPGVWT